MKKIIFFIMVFICNELFAQDILTEVVLNGNISYLDKILNVKQINNLTKSELQILRNTIYAKYGYKFSSNDLINHFSQFSWYKGNKINVEKDLKDIDWKNIDLIQKLENNYEQNVKINEIINKKIQEKVIDYYLDMTANGLYYFDENFNLIPIIENNTNDIKFGSYEGYSQFENILFFNSYITKALIFDYLTKKTFEIEISYIDSIKFVTKEKLLIKGKKHIVDGRDDEKRNLEINFDNRNTSNEIIGKEINERAYSNRETENIYSAWYFNDFKSIDWEGLIKETPEGHLGFINLENESVSQKRMCFIKIFGKNIFINYTYYHLFSSWDGFVSLQYNENFNIYFIFFETFLNDR